MEKFSMKKIALLCALLVFVLFAVSCSEATDEMYLAEEITGKVEEGSEEWKMISDMLGMLTVDSAVIPEFDSMKESTELFRDSLLNYLCCKNYSKYAGNVEMIEKVKNVYPDFDGVAVISSGEFENEMYRAFGGKVKLTHGSTELFTHLDEVGVYVPVTAPIEGGVDITLLSVNETKNTYRLEFYCEADEFYAEYFAMLVKREDGSCYFSMVLGHEG